ncbi:MAG: DUF5615 family PIN-like protein [Sphingobacteriaceae bacterium]|nr:DUF5615 family PIN-like protein [Cytophagaceae bacterium]
MKLYLDENLSPRFRTCFDSNRFEVFTFQFMGWQGKKNGELLLLLQQEKFRGLITADQLMYSDEQLRRSGLHFFLVRSASDALPDRLSLMNRLNSFLLEHDEKLRQATASKSIVTDGIVSPDLPAGAHLVWIR